MDDDTSWSRSYENLLDLETFLHLMDRNAHGSSYFPYYRHSMSGEEVQFVNLAEVENISPIPPPEFDFKKPEDPLTRYLTAEWDEEAVSLDKIKEAASLDKFKETHYNSPPPENPPPLVHSDIIDASSTVTGFTSFASHTSSSVTGLRRRRKHKLRNMPRNSPPTRQRSPEKNQFQCTFGCSTTFSNTGNWSRHEREIHLIVEEWICSPHGATENGCCMYCNKLEEECQCSDASRHCALTPEDVKIFGRKDHLIQHLEKSHGVPVSRQVPEGWTRKGTLPAVSRCGFCDLDLNSWQERVSHLAKEFKAGVSMEDWKGDWGLEPRWMARLQDATLPELRRQMKG